VNAVSPAEWQEVYNKLGRIDSAEGFSDLARLLWTTGAAPERRGQAQDSTFYRFVRLCSGSCWRRPALGKRQSSACSECHTVEADALTESIRICGHIRSKLGQNAGVGLFRCDEGSGIHWDSTSIHLFLAAPAT